MSKGNGDTKEFCGKCHLSFGLAEKRVAVDRTTVMHEDCYEKHLHELAVRADRIHNFTRSFSRLIH